MQYHSPMVVDYGSIAAHTFWVGNDSTLKGGGDPEHVDKHCEWSGGSDIDHLSEQCPDKSLVPHRP